MASGTVVGVVVYTGAETRAVMNTSAPQSKVGVFDLEINHLSKVLFGMMVLLSFVMVLLKVSFCVFFCILSDCQCVCIQVNMQSKVGVFYLEINHLSKVLFVMMVLLSFSDGQQK